MGPKSGSALAADSIRFGSQIHEERRTHTPMITLISNLLAFLRRDEEGQTLVEYGLLLALIAIVVIAALIILGPTVSGIFDSVNTELEP